MAMAAARPVKTDDDTEVALELADLIAKQEIHELLMRFLRGMDRQDWDSVRSCYHPGAVHDHGTFRGPIDELIEREKKIYEHFVSNTHFAGNELIDVDGDVARSELYSVCWHRIRARDGQPETDSLSGMRYFDDLERREGEWRIANRLIEMDWQREDPVSTGVVNWSRVLGHQ
jgi:hypothetical protein